MVLDLLGIVWAQVWCKRIPHIWGSHPRLGFKNLLWHSHLRDIFTRDTGFQALTWDPVRA